MIEHLFVEYVSSQIFNHDWMDYICTNCNLVKSVNKKNGRAVHAMHPNWDWQPGDLSCSDVMLKNIIE